MSEGNNKITVGQVTEQLNTKVDTDLGNIDSTTYPDGIDYVIEWQTPTAANNHTWYRLYKSGWVEQGGYGEKGQTITLPVEMADTNYVVQVTNDFNDATNQYGSQCNGRSVTQIIIKCGSYSSGDQIHANWQVSGMSAS